MKTFHKALVAAAAASFIALPAAHAAGGENMDVDAFVKMCDADKDGMVSKAEAMKMVEKMFDKNDTKKMGKLDKKQVEQFLKDLMQSGG